MARIRLPNGDLVPFPDQTRSELVASLQAEGLDDATAQQQSVALWSAKHDPSVARAWLQAGASLPAAVRPLYAQMAAGGAGQPQPQPQAAAASRGTPVQQPQPQPRQLAPQPKPRPVPAPVGRVKGPGGFGSLGGPGLGGFLGLLGGNTGAPPSPNFLGRR